MSEPGKRKKKKLPWTHPEWRPWRPYGREPETKPESVKQEKAPAGDSPLVVAPAPPRRRRLRLHWTHPDWRPWRRHVFVDDDEGPARPAEKKRSPVVDGVRLVKLPWSHPKWRPWRRWVAPEAAHRDAGEKALDKLEEIVRGKRFPWGRAALVLGLFMSMGLGSVLSLRLWRAHRNPYERSQYLMGVAQIALELDDRERALAAIEEAHRLRPDDHLVAGWLAEVRGEVSPAETERMLRALPEDARQRDPTVAARLAALLLQRRATSEAWATVAPAADALIRRAELDRVRWLLIAGTAALEAGALADAEVLLRSASRTARPEERVHVLTRLGDALLRADRVAQALQVLEEALADAPGDRDATVLLAHGLIEAGRSDEALARARAVLAKDGVFEPEAAVGLADLHLRLGEREAARAVAVQLAQQSRERALEAEARAAEVAATTIRTRLALGDGDLAAAEAASRRLLELDPGSATGHLSRIAVFQRTGDLAGLRGALESAGKARPDLVEVELGLLDLDLIAERWEAVEERALALAGDARTRARGLQAFALVQARAGSDPARARARLDAIQRRFPADPLIRIHVAVFALLAGQDPEGKLLGALASETDLTNVFSLLAQVQMGRTDALEAVEMISGLVGRDSRFVPARLVLAGFWERLEREDLALREYDEAIRVDPALRTARLARARLLLRTGDVERACAELAAMGDDAVALSLLGEVRFARGGMPEAIEALQRAIALAPEGRLLALLGRAQARTGDHAAALASLERARKLTPTLVEAHLDGAVLLDLGDHDGAERAFELASATLRQPGLVKALAAVRALRGHSRRALEELAALGTADAPELDLVRSAPPHSASTRLALEVFALLAIGWVQEAERRARSVPPESLDRVALGWCARACRSAPADVQRPLLERLTAVEPGDVEAWLARARLESDPAQYLSVLDQATTHAPADPRLALSRGVVLDTLGRPTDARAEYERILAAGQRDPIALNNLACVLGGDPAERPRALELAREAVSLRPESPLLRDTLGGLLLQVGQHEEAIRHLSSAVSRAPAAADVRFRLAQALRGHGELLRARNHVRLALLGADKIDPAVRAEREGFLVDLDRAIEEARGR